MLHLFNLWALKAADGPWDNIIKDFWNKMHKYDHSSKIQAVFQNCISIHIVQLSTMYTQAAVQAIMIDFLTKILACI